MQKGPGYYHHHQQQQQQRPPRGNQMVYSPQQLNQLPNLSSQHNNTLMQAPMQTGPRPSFGAGGPNDTHGIRPMVGTRMPMNHQYGQQSAGPTDVGGGYGSPQFHAYHVQTQNNMSQFTSSYGNHANYLPRGGSGYSPVYVVPQSSGYGSNVVIAPSPSQGHQAQTQQPQQQQQHVYSQHGNVHASQQPHLQQQQQQQQQQADHQPKKRTTIKLTDPNTGKDLTSEILTKKNSKTTPAKPTANPDESIKAKTAALFAAQVAKKIAGSTPPPANENAATPPPSESGPAKESAPIEIVEVNKDVKEEPASVVEPPAQPTPLPTEKTVETTVTAESEENTVSEVKSEADAVVVADEKVVIPDAVTESSTVTTPTADKDTLKNEKQAEIVKETPIEKQQKLSTEATVPEPTPDSPVEETDGVKVEPVAKVDGKIRPICKVEDATLTNDVKLAAELVDKMNGLEVKEAVPTPTVVEVKTEEKIDRIEDEVVASSREVLVTAPVEKATSLVEEKAIEIVEATTTESVPHIDDASACAPVDASEKEVVNEEHAKKENKNVKNEKNTKDS